VAADLVWSPQARRDLLHIYLTIGLERPDAAERYFDRIVQRTEQLIDQPRLGVRRPDIRPKTRMLVESPYLILYETIPNTDAGPVRAVEIVRIVHGRRDLTSVLD
jgi:toxin ParE1/3/4